MPSPRSLPARLGALAAPSLCLSLGLPATAPAEEPVPVVATFSILGDMVERIGGDRVELTTLVGRDGDAHVYRPTPQAARAVGEAELLFVNGLEFEGWIERLSEAAAFDGTVVVATAGIEPIAYEEGGHGEHHDDEHEGDEHDDHDDDEHDHGTFDPHTWLSPALGIAYVDNITAALAKAAPDGASAFHDNRAAYVAELEALDAEIDAMLSALPEGRRTVVTSHDAFGYFARDYGLSFTAPQGLSTDSEASAQDVARLIEQMREDEVSAVFVENIADSRLIEQIAAETGATVGGTLYPGALSEEGGPAASYLDLLRHNAATLARALGGGE